jgi:adenosylhomocysteine nucleosidase
LSSARSVIALVGLDFEARIAAGPEVHVVCRDAGANLEGPLVEAVQHGCRSIISFGIAGGLSPHLRPGDWIVASSIVDSGKRKPTDAEWSRKLLRQVPRACYAPVAGVDAPVSDPAVKREWHCRTGAVACDMESHHVARFAAAHDLAFAAVRVIVDPVHRHVPPAALAGMRPDGKTDAGAVLRSLATAPGQAIALMRLAADAFRARTSLERGRRLLGPGMGRLETGHEQVNIPTIPNLARDPGLLSGIGGHMPPSLAGEELLA